MLKDRLEGIGWFSYQTLKRITLNNPQIHFVFLFDRYFDEEFIFSDNITPVVLSPQARHPFLYYAWLQYSVKGLLNRMQPDLFLSPDGFLALGAKCKQLPVIHDINFVHYPKDNKWLTSKYYNYYFPKFTKEATRIATVSEFSKNELIEQYKINPTKIDVVYNGINSFFKPIDKATQQKTRERYTNGKNYFVNIGSLHPRKNIPTLINAFSAFKKESQSDFKLVLAGPSFWGLSDIHSAINESHCKEDIIFTGRLNDADLACVLGSAIALTFIPYYEGFGIPLVEAMEAEVPIITSNVTSLPEIAGDAALLVNPKETNNIKNAMLRIFSEENLRKALIEKGKIQKQKFSWDKSADLLWDSVQKTINSK
ncbi:glycosyltransferase family 4 protein [Aurantibacillus circumpalustris]|uniref:glycosyltransferase family 4 protein n=1 Tax=Aurantibacillus circumpalustris TaxID=3036359 RepID=UPI00295AFBC5|nr:glycosyltransferase family 1 protein [Aurantibacillus circumpalustris]